MHSYCKMSGSKKELKKIKKEISEDDDDDDSSVYCICRTKDTSRFMIGCDSCNEWYHGDCISITEEYAKNIIKFFCLMCRERDPMLEIKFKEKKEKCEKVKSEKPDKESKRSEVYYSKPKKSARRCGECISCYRTEDCGRCDFCKGLIFGKKPPYKDKYSYNSSHEESTEICQEENEEDEDGEDKDPTYCPPEKKPRGHSSDHDDDYEPEPKSKKSTSKKYNKSQTKQSEGRKRSSRHKIKKDEYGIEKEKTRGKKEEEVIKQCYGPACVNAARIGSKYCSDSCGMKLATNRIFEFLPHRIRQWQSTTCLAEEKNRLALESIRRQQQEAKQILTQLDKRQENLENLIERAKKTPIALEQEVTDGESEEGELSVYCVTCGHEIGARTALKHMERCFNKYESQTSFGSIYKTRIEGSNVFCDFYNPQQRTYCKRLRILCPEHSKDPKINDDEVCGCPAVTNVFEQTGEFCRILKKKCIKHYCWDKLRRAEIDMERVRQWLQLDELMEQERNIRIAMANRGGVLGLMLHQTIAHEPLFEVPPPGLE